MGYEYRIGELAARFGISTDTLRLYDEIGLLPAHKRPGSSYRMYNRADFFCLAYIMRLRQAGMPLEDIRVLVTEGSIGRAAEMMRRQNESVRAQIEHLEDLYAVTRDYCAGFETTIASLGRFTVLTAPRMLYREMEGSVFEATAAFGALAARHVPRLSFITPLERILSPQYEEVLGRADATAFGTRLAVVLADESGELAVPEGSGIRVIPPRRCVFSGLRNRTGRDYSGYIDLLRFAREHALTPCDDMISMAISMRNDRSDSKDYYQVWLPVEEA